jgi:glutamine cyclotransferase
MAKVDNVEKSDSVVEKKVEKKSDNKSKKSSYSKKKKIKKVILNGIAYDPKNNRLFVTGKNWKKMFEIALVKK